MSRPSLIRAVSVLVAVGSLCTVTQAQAAGTPADWAAEEAPILTGHVRLTSPDRFTKAGEAYFSPDGQWIIFQAVEVGQPASSPYGMYAAKLVRTVVDVATGQQGGDITGIEEPILLSPPGSANTCGWFHPTDPTRVMFGSTITTPKSEEAPGFKVGTSRYVWAFPAEMEVCTRTIPGRWIEKNGGWPGENAPEDWDVPVPMFERHGYDAECTWSPDGRHVLYAHVEPGTPDENGVLPPADADIWVYDTKSGKQTPLVAEPGYDGGPFFSADGTWICYRSDRARDDHLQIYTAELAFDAQGAITGISREIALTANDDVNWCPYWHPNGRFLLYATSELGHDNYEVFAIDADPEVSIESRRRIPVTMARGADVLPAFDASGKWMMWTSRRIGAGAAEGTGSSQLWIARFNAAALEQKLMMPEPGTPVSN